MANYEDTFEKLVELQHMIGALRHRHANPNVFFAILDEHDRLNPF